MKLEQDEAMAIADYAEDAMRAEDALRHMHMAMEEFDYDRAIALGTEAVVHAKLAVTLVKLAKEQKEEA